MNLNKFTIVSVVILSMLTLGVFLIAWGVNRLGERRLVRNYGHGYVHMLKQHAKSSHRVR